MPSSTGTMTRSPIIAGRLSPGGRIDHRVASSDPKWIWELNRLQHLPVLAQAWLFTGETRYAEMAFDHLDSWLEQNPIGTGIAWRGAFEAGIRAISVAIALQGLRNSSAMTTERYRRVVRMLDASARYCWHGRSRFSSANNHLVGELAGLMTVHMLFPELAAPTSLYSRAVATLASEAERQILPDGAGAEQSVVLPDLHRRAVVDGGRAAATARWSGAARVGQRRWTAARSTLSPSWAPTTRTLDTETTTTVSRSGWVPSPNERSASTSGSWRRSLET